MCGWKSSFDCLLCVIKKILNLCVNSYIHRWNYARSKIHTHRNIHALCPPHRGAGSMHRSRVVCRSGWGAAAAKGTRGAEAAACCWLHLSNCKIGKPNHNVNQAWHGEYEFALCFIGAVTNKVHRCICNWLLFLFSQGAISVRLLRMLLWTGNSSTPRRAALLKQVLLSMCEIQSPSL